MYFALFILPSILTSLPVSAADKHPHTPMLYRRDGARCPPDVTLVIQAKELNLGFIRPENLVSHGLSPLGALRQTPSGLSCAFYCGVASVWPLYNKGLIGGVLQEWLSF